MVKLLGVLCVAVSVAIFGILKASGFNSRVKYLQAALSFSEQAVHQMQSLRQDVFSIYRSCTKAELEFLKLITPDNISSKEELKKILKSNGIFECDIELFAEFFSSLGNSDIDGQRLLCTQFLTAVGQRLKAAQRDSLEKGRLQRTLYLLLSAAIMIILI